MTKRSLNNQLLIFDLDGTLVDSANEITFCVNQIRNRYDFPYQSVDEVRPKIGYPAKFLFQELESELPITKLVEEFREILSKVAGSMCSPFPGVANLLSLLQRSAAISAVATSKPTRLAEKILLNLDLPVSYVQGIDNLPPKPDPTILNMCISKFSVIPSEVMMIGDTPLDVEAGKSAGVLTVALDHGTRSKQELIDSQPDFLFSDFQEFSFWYQEKFYGK